MDNQISKIDFDAINELFKSFYLLTKFRIVLFDNEYKQVVSYPPHDCKFCSLLQSHNELRKCCIESNHQSFLMAKETNDLYVYRCHAGLIEATYPIVDNKKIILGYIMIGQISDLESEEQTKNLLTSFLNNRQIVLDDYNNLLDAPNKTKDEIFAAKDIIEACTLYLVLKNTIEYEEKSFITKLDYYIDKHIGENLSIDILMDEFGLKRNAIYETFSRYSDVSLAKYIKKKRIEKAKELLITTKKSVKEISDEIGFTDYNYFCRLFKKECGIPAKKYRNNHHKLMLE